MPTVQVTADDGRVTLTERVSPAVLATEHACATLGERIRWAAADAEDPQPQPSTTLPKGSDPSAVS